MILANQPSYETYEVQDSDSHWRGEECNEWMCSLLPPKSKGNRPCNKNGGMTQHQSRMTAAELERLYSTDMKKALHKIQFIPEILCEVDPTDLRYGLLQQLGAAETTPTALRVNIYPMLFHLLENSSSTITQLEMMNRKLRKMAKRILCLPERAATSYLHLHRMYGGPGLPDLVIAKSKLALQTLVRSLNTTGQFGDYLRRLLLENKDLQYTLDAINNGNTKGLCDTIKEASRSLQRLKKFLQVDLQLTILEERVVTLAIDGSSYKDPWPTFSRCLQKQSLKELQKAPNQGRIWKTLAETPLTTKAVFNFHTRLCDFRFIHRARLNLVPVRANNAWNPPENQNCRRCQADRETLNDMLSNCSVMRKKIIKRHNDVRDLLAT